ncbi:calcium-dependent secretion activator [Pimephales promelas]|nr:calcium-dependent secretion activator [Pimephales promelas]
MSTERSVSGPQTSSLSVMGGARREGLSQSNGCPLDSGCHCFVLPAARPSVPPWCDGPFHSECSLLLALAHGASLTDICRAAGWATPNTFARFYNLRIEPVSSHVLVSASSGSAQVSSLARHSTPGLDNLESSSTDDAGTTALLWMLASNGSGTSEDLFWKLDALQTFIRDLHWPEEEFAKHLESRLKLMSSDMIESCVKRTRAAFEVKLQKSPRTTDFRVAQSICTMFNVMVDAKAQSAKLCAIELSQERQYHSQIDDLIEETVKEMITLLVAKFVVILESVLAKLSRYDEGTLFSSFLSFTVKAASKYVDVPKPGMDVADSYVTFVRHSQDVLRDKVNEEIYIERLFDQWYTSTMNLLGTWLTDRMDLQLHLYQLKILIRIVKKKYRDFRLQGVLDSTLNSKMYETVRNRLILEEATASVREGGMQGISMKDSDEEDD